MPEQVRDILKWNPVLQGLELFRSGFFPDYEPYWLDIPYLCACSFGSFLLGLALVRVLRRHLKLPT
jgi:capsular polysaccharide transport system permease protein